MDEQRYTRRADCFWRRTLDGVLALGAHAHDPIHIAGAGAVAWDLLAEPTSLAELADRVADTFDQRPDTLVGEFAVLLEQLVQLELIDREAPAPVTDR